MRQLPGEKYNVAWYKLAEFVARGEKERALGLHRLLVHSFDDKALALQLEGDLLWAFEDDSAQEKYSQAAELYKREGRFMEAAAIFEHIVEIQPNEPLYRKELLDIYQLLHNQDALIEHLTSLVHYYCEKKQLDRASQLLLVQEKRLHSAHLISLYQYVIIEWAQQKAPIVPLCIHILSKLLECLMLEKGQDLDTILKKLESLHEVLHQQAIEILSKS